MTKPLPFTESHIRRTIAAARKEGLAITATSVHPDGTVTVHHQGVAVPLVPAQNGLPPQSEWEDIQA
jgi:hypothetical protein